MEFYHHKDAGGRTQMDLRIPFEVLVVWEDGLT